MSKKDTWARQMSKGDTWARRGGGGNRGIGCNRGVQENALDDVVRLAAAVWHHEQLRHAVHTAAGQHTPPLAFHAMPDELP